MHIQGLLTPGSALGRYELLMPIAQGGMAAVWAARQMGSRGFEKTVAVKTMLPKLKEDPMFERMFLNEATLATKIQHPNVAQILDLGEEGDLLYIVMEWVDGEALSLLMRAADQAGHAIPLDLAVGILERACWGLHAAHEVQNEHDENAGIVHRDVSPQNILVSYNGAVKVVDFGVAKASGLSGMETNTGSLKGKVPFMSPEQASGGRIDRRTDVFAIGTLLYKLLTGTHPFVGANDLMTLQAIITEEPLRAREREPSISPELESIIMRCLQKDMSLRFPNMAELAQALAHAAPRVSEQDIAAYIGKLTGARGAQRRTTLKQAARSLGWSVQTSDQLPRVYQQQPTPSTSFTPPNNGSGSQSGNAGHSGAGSMPGHSGYGAGSQPGYGGSGSISGSASGGAPQWDPRQASLTPPAHRTAVTFAHAPKPTHKQGVSGAGIALIVLAALGGMSLVIVVFMLLRTQHPVAASTASTAVAAGATATLPVVASTPAAPTTALPAASAKAPETPSAQATPSSAPSQSSNAVPHGTKNVPKPTTPHPATTSAGTGEVDMGF